MIIRLRIPAERDAPRCEASDGEQEIGGLRRIGTTGGELRRAFRRDEAGVAVLPSVELAVEKGTALPVIPQSRQMGIDAGYESTCAVVEPVGFRRPRLVLVFRRHLVPASHSAGCGKIATLCSRPYQLHFVVMPGIKFSCGGRCCSPALPIRS